MSIEELGIDDYQDMLSYYSKSSNSNRSLYPKIKELIDVGILSFKWFRKLIFEIKILYSEVQNESDNLRNIYCWFLDGFSFENGRLIYNLPVHLEYNIDESEIYNFYLPTTLFHENIVEFIIMSPLFMIPQISEIIDNMKDLEKLVLPSLYIEELPKSIGKLDKLTYLNLNNNLLEKLPDPICELPKLKNLYLKNNNLKYLPKEMGRLSTLEFIDLRDNPLIGLPVSIEHLGSLNNWSLLHIKRILRGCQQ